MLNGRYGFTYLTLGLGNEFLCLNEYTSTNHVLYDAIKMILESNPEIQKKDLLERLQILDRKYIVPNLNKALNTLKVKETRYYESFYKELEENGWSLYERWEKSNFNINLRDDDKAFTKEGTLLHSACIMGDYEVANWLIRNGACVNAVTDLSIVTLWDREFLNSERALKTTNAVRPLHIAAYKGDLNMVKLLINNGVNPNTFDENRINAMDMAKYGLSTFDFPGREKEYKQIISILSPITTVKDYSRFIYPSVFFLNLVCFCSVAATVCCIVLGAQNAAFGLAAVSITCLILAVTKHCLTKNISSVHEKQMLETYKEEKKLLSEQQPELSLNDISLCYFNNTLVRIPLEK